MADMAVCRPPNITLFSIVPCDYTLWSELGVLHRGRYTGTQMQGIWRPLWSSPSLSAETNAALEADQETQYTHFWPDGAPYLTRALRGTSFPIVHNSAATLALYLRPVTSSSWTICASVECNKGMVRVCIGRTKSLEVDTFVRSARPTGCCILPCACLPSRAPSKQGICVSRYQKSTRL